MSTKRRSLSDFISCDTCDPCDPCDPYDTRDPCDTCDTCDPYDPCHVCRSKINEAYLALNYHQPSEL